MIKNMLRVLSKLKKAPKVLSRSLARYINQRHCSDYPSCGTGWVKYDGNPVFGDVLTGNMFDPHVIRDHGVFKMVVSSRKNGSIILAISKDGINWDKGFTILSRREGTWENIVNRGCLVEHDGMWHLWYTGQNNGKGCIGYATSLDGRSFHRVIDVPIITPTTKYEGVSVMNPCVLWDEDNNLWRMWYSAGDNYEPDVICYAESTNGIDWTKYTKPVLAAYPSHRWEKEKVGGCSVVKDKDGKFLIYYIAYQNVDVARICTAMSTDGVTFERDDYNLVLGPDSNAWDSNAVYKPSVLICEGYTMLWYNGRKNHSEYIGLALNKR